MSPESKKRAILLLDLQNIEDAARQVGKEVSLPGSVWDEELYQKVRALRDEILGL